MNISLEEQIEYMREELLYWRTADSVQKMDMCKAILATLEAVKAVREAVVPERKS